MSRSSGALCIKPKEIAAAIYPAVIAKVLVIHGFTLDDRLVEMLMLLDTSKGVDLVDFTIPDVVQLFSSAEKVLFFGDERHETLDNLMVEVPEMDSEQMNNIPHGNLISLYHNIVPWTRDFSRRRNVNRLVRKAIAFDDEQPVTEMPISRLQMFLNNPDEWMDRTEN